MWQLSGGEDRFRPGFFAWKDCNLPFLHRIRQRCRALTYRVAHDIMVAALHAPQGEHHAKDQKMLGCIDAPETMAPMHLIEMQRWATLTCCATCCVRSGCLAPCEAALPGDVCP